MSKIGKVSEEKSLSREEEIELAKCIEDGDKRAREALVKANFELVKRLASFISQKHKVPLADLIQEGNKGLMRAVETFDYRKGFRFSAYAAWCIRQAITRALDNSI